MKPLKGQNKIADRNDRDFRSISQLSLKPGEEEIKKKGWWQFWKRD
jgi:hypothetical protein